MVFDKDTRNFISKSLKIYNSIDFFFEKYLFIYCKFNVICQLEYSGEFQSEFLLPKDLVNFIYKLKTEDKIIISENEIIIEGKGSKSSGIVLLRRPKWPLEESDYFFYIDLNKFISFCSEIKDINKEGFSFYCMYRKSLFTILLSNEYLIAFSEIEIKTDNTADSFSNEISFSLTSQQFNTLISFFEVIKRENAKLGISKSSKYIVFQLLGHKDKIFINIKDTNSKVFQQLEMISTMQPDLVIEIFNLREVFLNIENMSKLFKKNIELINIDVNEEKALIKNNNEQDLYKFEKVLDQVTVIKLNKHIIFTVPYDYIKKIAALSTKNKYITLSFIEKNKIIICESLEVKFCFRTI